MQIPDGLPHDQHHMEKYMAFCELYGIENRQLFVEMYDIYELVCFMPAKPSEHEKTALNSLIGVGAESVYTDYQRSTNTFELIMQWQEQTGNFNNDLPFNPGLPQ